MFRLYSGEWKLRQESSNNVEPDQPYEFAEA